MFGTHCLKEDTQKKEGEEAAFQDLGRCDGENPDIWSGQNHDVGIQY